MMIISINLSIVHLICYVSWVLANIMTESSCCFRKCGGNLGPRFWADYHILIYIHCWEWMQSLGSHGSSSLLFVMKVKVWHFVRNSHKAVMTAPMSYNLQIVLGEISVQFVERCIDVKFLSVSTVWSNVLLFSCSNSYDQAWSRWRAESFVLNWHLSSAWGYLWSWFMPHGL